MLRTSVVGRRGLRSFLGFSRHRLTMTVGRGLARTVYWGWGPRPSGPTFGLFRWRGDAPVCGRGLLFFHCAPSGAPALVLRPFRGSSTRVSVSCIMAARRGKKDVRGTDTPSGGSTGSMDFQSNVRHCLLVLAMLPVACDSDANGGNEADSGTPQSNDPRCAALCTDEPPNHEDAYDVCSTASLGQCVELCEVRIENTETLCAECLLEGAWLDSPSSEESAICNSDGTCYLGISLFCGGCLSESDGELGCCDGPIDYESDLLCAYERGDELAEASCHAELHPREDVSCEVEFESVTACADVCG